MFVRSTFCSEFVRYVQILKRKRKINCTNCRNGILSVISTLFDNLVRPFLVGRHSTEYFHFPYRIFFFFNLVGVIRRNISENIFRRWRIDEICAHISSTEYGRRNINIPSLHKVRSNITLQLCHLHHYILVIYKNST